MQPKWCQNRSGQGLWGASEAEATRIDKRKDKRQLGSPSLEPKSFQNGTRSGPKIALSLLGQPCWIRWFDHRGQFSLPMSQTHPMYSRERLHRLCALEVIQKHSLWQNLVATNRRLSFWFGLLWLGVGVSLFWVGTKNELSNFSCLTKCQFELSQDYPGRGFGMNWAIHICDRSCVVMIDHWHLPAVVDIYHRSCIVMIDHV